MQYSELGEENIPASKSFDANSETKSNGQVKTGRIKKSSELRKSLISSEVDEERGESSMNGNSDDPYYVFKEDLVIKLDLVEDSLERYERLVKDTDTAANKAAVKEGKKELKRHIKNAESTLKDLQTTVKMVEKKREKFPNITDAELIERKSFTMSCMSRIKTCKDGMNSQGIKTKMLRDQRSWTKRKLNLSPTKSMDNEEANFIENNHASAQLMMEQQDDTLDELDSAVVRVSGMAENIHEELGQQNKMLKELDEDLTNVEEELGLVVGKLAKMLKTKNKFQLCTILALSAVVVVLLFLVMYT